MVPPSIGGLGSTQLKLRPSPAFDPMKAKVAPEEYFLFSRFDGNIALRDVLLESGLPMDRAIAIVMKLRSLGALLLPTESTPPKPEPAAPVAVPTPPSAPVLDTTLPNTTAEERAALAETSALTEPQRRQLLAMARLLDKRDPYALLGVAHDADAKTLKRAYFKLSKEIHPDRFYGKQLGSFGPLLSTVFEAVSKSYDRLTNPDKAAQASNSPATETTQSPQEYAAELFDRACTQEIAGDHLGAMKLFSAALRIDPQTRYLRRAATCALAAGQPRSALEYAKKAQAQSPNDPSLARLLASSFKAVGKLADAEEVLVMAMALKSENDVLTAELRNDLAEVRRLLNS
ncbi:MAG: tetratricopeptide repeat protein [Kofleriaceae bacterium]